MSQDSRFDHVRLIAVTGRVHESDLSQSEGFDYCLARPAHLPALDSWLIAHS
jgi:hypothetical protein